MPPRQPMATDSAHDVFLSYNSADRPMVEEIDGRLRARGLSPWLDTWELRPGFPFQEAMERGLREARSVAVCLGAAGLGDWQRPEMRAALNRSMHEQMPVIPLLLPGSLDSPEVAEFLAALVWVDLRGGLSEAGLDRLVWGITGVKSGTLLAPGLAGGDGARPGFATASAAARPAGRILLVARNLEEVPLSGLRFAHGDSRSESSGEAGETELKLPAGVRPGQQLKLRLVPGPEGGGDWLLVNSQVNVPCEPFAAEVVLVPRRVVREIAAAARDAARPPAASTAAVSTAALEEAAELSAEQRRRVLVEEAARHGLTEAQLDSALRSFADSGGAKDRGIAAYLGNQLAEAEELLGGAVDKKEEDLVETLRYLGRVQFEQAKYRAAEASFRKAVALRGDDEGLLSWLGTTLLDLADWPAAEPVLRRALQIAEDAFGPQQQNVATALNNLAQLFQATNRLAEAEPLMRRALDIDEHSFGPQHPEVATDLNNLAQLLKATNRLAEAEPLMRRALDIDEHSFGPQHPEVAIRLNNLAGLLQATNRLAEAEPLMRRALDIDEHSLGPEHPGVATNLNNLAQLLKATSRPAEAEPLMRRALDIDEHSLGPLHPGVATDLNNLAQLLKATNRLAKAEPLMRRALDIDEHSLGPLHPKVARDLNNLATLLHDTNRLAEAEPLMRRALGILLAFTRTQSHEHPKGALVLANYRALLHALGRSEAEIDIEIETLRSAQ